MVKKSMYLIIFVIFQIIFSSLTIVVSEMDKELAGEQKHDTEYYWWYICIIIGTFSEKSIDDDGWIDQIITNNTNGVAFGLLRNNENPDETTPKFLFINNMTVSIMIPYPYSFGYIGNNFMCMISRDCCIR